MKVPRGMHWHPETLWCSLRGHCAPGLEVREVRRQDALIALNLSDGGHVARCLRCDAWLIADPAVATKNVLPELEQVSIPERGKDLRDAIVLKVIAIDRGFHAIAFGLVAIGILLLETHLAGLQGQARRLVLSAQNSLNDSGQGPSRAFAVRELHRFINLKKTSLEILFGTALLYAVVEGVEAVGLWRRRRWAEYLTAVATAGFLPLEIHELIKKVTVLRVGALVINIAVLAYLLYAKRLFGIRGGMNEDTKLVRAADVIKLLPGQPTIDDLNSAK